MIPYILIGVGGILYTIADIFCLKWLENTKIMGWWWGAIIAYSIGMIGLIESFKHIHIAIATVLIGVFNVVFLLIVSAVFFNKPITWVQVIGLVLGGLAIYLLSK